MREEDLKKIHKLVLKMFKNDHQGYCWIDAKFGKLNWGNRSEKSISDILSCLRSKKERLVCPTHNRVHGEFKS